MRPQPTTSDRGLGWAHQRQRAGLLRRHRDGTPCPCTDCGPGCPCRAAGLPPGRGLPMWKDKRRNPAGMALEADHSLARAHGGTTADRLLHALCNRSRQTGHPTPTHRPNSRAW